MTWLQRYRLRRILSWSLWLLPALSIGLVFVVAPLLRWLDHITGWNWFNFTPDGARCILGAFTSSMLTFVVFVVSSLLIVVQLASAQITPRIIAPVFADRRLKWVLSIFTFAYTYTIAASARIEDTTPQLPVAFAIFCNLACIVIFFWFVQWMGGSLRPIAVLQSIANEGRAVVESVYPERFNPAEEQPGWAPRRRSGVRGREAGRHRGDRQDGSPFLPIGLPVSIGAPIEVVHPRGHVIRVPAIFDVTALGHILAVIDAPAAASGRQ
jgi:uncharacterized membrane protein